MRVVRELSIVTLSTHTHTHTNLLKINTKIQILRLQYNSKNPIQFSHQEFNNLEVIDPPH